MRCEKCRNELQPGVRFCGECGHPVAESKKETHCTNCQEELVPGDAFCGNCGQRVGGAAVAPALTDPPELTTIVQERKPEDSQPAGSTVLETQIGPPKDSPTFETSIGQPKQSPAPQSVETDRAAAVLPAQVAANQPPPQPPVQQPTYHPSPPPPAPPPPAGQPPPPPPSKGQGFLSANRTWLTFGSIGCLVLVCFGSILVLGLLFQQSQGDDLAQTTPVFTPTTTSEIPLIPFASSTSAVPLPGPTDEVIVTEPPTDDGEVIVEALPATATAIPEAPTATPLPPSTASPAAAVRQPSEFNSDLAQIISDSGAIWIGVSANDFWPLSYIDDDGNFAGFEIDLATRVIERMFGPEVEIFWIPLTAAERFEALDIGDVDILFRTVSHTISREELGAFTMNYFLSGSRLAVNEISGIRGLEDINGHSVAFLGGTTTELELTTAASNLGIFWEPVAYENMGDACLDFLTGDVAVLVSDWIVILNCTSGDIDMPIVGNLLSEYGRTDGFLGGEPTAAMVALGDEDFRDEVDSVLEEFFSNGTWWAIYDRYFSEEPWTLEEMIAEPPVDR